ncbi:L-glutamine synthetase [Hathewaya proteolytica DSM 3090]|uniref:glutamine synthetase n=1 Tax=Hathewaya proteolytica DSM 3090 TaxID=1121331 RepID=A0A1M6TAK8_9CLOT|nr:glutamine synthetase [Hathewaya proteolytica]SHK54000.1 L-glutamine synthetase [Hathewaya proteolytica DSM 3090]
MFKDLIYFIPKELHNEKDLISILDSHQEIKFVSFVGIDLSGNDTDERIPIKLFKKNIREYLYASAIQTDGSSVVLPNIATLNNGKLDMKADLHCNWFVDYNYENIDESLNAPVGTLKVPCYLLHDGKAVDSRAILRNAITYFRDYIHRELTNYTSLCDEYGFSPQDIDSIDFTAATELEFWVNTPNHKADIDELTASQNLKEQYWKKTHGAVRTALEQTLCLMSDYGFEPEMGHKEVGGVTAQVEKNGAYSHIMEQLEIDWRFSDAIQACDNEIFIRNLIEETFRRNGLNVTFLAKPIHGVAGSGKHLHLGVVAKMKNGRLVNLFTSVKDDFLSLIGYGALMGILNHYEAINPFVSSTTDALNRLKPGFEAPVSIVTSLGHDVKTPSRNRTILIALIRDMKNPMATRFELRSPNPLTNVYLSIASCFMAMLDGINYAVISKKDSSALLKELSKKPMDKGTYLKTQRQYRSELNIFEDYTSEEREMFFGYEPRTVYENFKALDDETSTEFLKKGDIFLDPIIKSYKTACIEKWIKEIQARVLHEYSKEIIQCKKLHITSSSSMYDDSLYAEIQKLRMHLKKNTSTAQSLFTQMGNAISESNFNLVSKLQIEIDSCMSELRSLYSTYAHNQLCDEIF